MKDYKDKEKIFIISFIMLIVSIVLLVNVLKKDVRDYYIKEASLVSNKTYSIYLKEKYVSFLKKNHYVYIDSKKIKIEIISHEKKVYEDYDRLLIKLYKKKVNNIEKISIYNNKKSFLKIFLECWEDKNGKD